MNKYLLIFLSTHCALGMYMYSSYLPHVVGCRHCVEIFLFVWQGDSGMASSLTVFIRIVAAAINFSFARVRLLFEGGSYYYY